MKIQTKPKRFSFHETSNHGRRTRGHFLNNIYPEIHHGLCSLDCRFDFCGIWSNVFNSVPHTHRRKNKVPTFRGYATTIFRSKHRVSNLRCRMELLNTADTQSPYWHSWLGIHETLPLFHSIVFLFNSFLCHIRFRTFQECWTGILQRRKWLLETGKLPALR